MGSVTLEDRFWAKVERGPTDACWAWKAATDPSGYGQFWNPSRRTMGLAHRFAYEAAFGPLPAKPPRAFGAQGVLVCHSCDNRSCCNPAHLFLGSQGDNMADMRSKGRSPDNRGESNPRAKLTAAAVGMIRSEYTGRYGEKSTIARRYGISTGQVSKILLGRVWAAA